jgi:hypothetical protein
VLERREGSQPCNHLGNWSLEPCGRLLASLCAWHASEQTSCGYSSAANPLHLSPLFCRHTRVSPECGISTQIQIRPTRRSIPHHQPAKRLAGGPPPPLSASVALHLCLRNQSRPMLAHNANASLDPVIISTLTCKLSTPLASVINTLLQMLFSWLMLDAARIRHLSSLVASNYLSHQSHYAVHTRSHSQHKLCEPMH